MTSVNLERWGRAAGMGFVVTLIIGFIVMGNPPKVNDASDDIVSFFTDHRGRILAASIIFPVAFVLFVYFIGTIANALREAGQGWLAAVTIGAGAIWVALQAMIGAIVGGLALNIADKADAGVVTALNTLVNSVDVISAYAFAGMALAATIGLSRAGIMAGWYPLVGAVASVLVALHGTNWATSGFWSATGGYLWVTIIAGLGWTLITSAILYSKATVGERAPETAAARPT
jgi:hypothetical protein